MQVVSWGKIRTYEHVEARGSSGPCAHIGTYGHSMVKARSRLDGLPCDGGDQDSRVGEVLAVLVAVGVLECPVVVDDELSR